MKRPGPSTAPIQCTILRDAVTSKGQTIYTLYLDDPAKLILAAQKRKRSKTCSYTISLDYQVHMTWESPWFEGLEKFGVFMPSVFWAARYCKQ